MRIRWVLCYMACRIDHFTVVFLVAWPLNGNEAEGVLVLIQTLLLLLCKSSCCYVNYLAFTWEKQRGLCQTKVTSSLTCIHGQVTKNTTVKWPILVSMYCLDKNNFWPLSKRLGYIAQTAWNWKPVYFIIETPTRCRLGVFLSTKVDQSFGLNFFFSICKTMSFVSNIEHNTVYINCYQTTEIRTAWKHIKHSKYPAKFVQLNCYFYDLLAVRRYSFSRLGLLSLERTPNSNESCL